MTRVTLSEQVTVLQSHVATLEAKNSVLAAENQSLRAAVTSRDDELSKLRPLTAEAEQLRKKLAERDTTMGYVNQARAGYESELEQVHAVLDSIDVAPAREYEQEYGKGKRNAVTRLAGTFFALSKRG